MFNNRKCIWYTHLHNSIDLELEPICFSISKLKHRMIQWILLDRKHKLVERFVFICLLVTVGASIFMHVPPRTKIDLVSKTYNEEHTGIYIYI